MIHTHLPPQSFHNYLPYCAVCVLGRAVEHSTSDHRVPGSKPGVFKSEALSYFISLPGDRSVAHKTLAVKKVTLNKTISLTHFICHTPDPLSQVNYRGLQTGSKLYH